jgi:glutamate racemase
MQKIGVFDSGVGGQSVVAAIEKRFPDAKVIFADDKQNLPYGTKTPQELLELVLPKLQSLEKQGVEAIVIACNTVTTTIIDQLREKLNVPLVGMEPMVKPAAAMTKTGVIAVCATPATLASKRYAQLKQKYATDTEVLEPDCSGWAYMIETKQVDQQKIAKITDELCKQKADVIVLGCTHYHWIEELIQNTATPQAKVIQPIEPVILQLERVLAQRP